MLSATLRSSTILILIIGLAGGLLLAQGKKGPGGQIVAGYSKPVAPLAKSKPGGPGPILILQKFLVLDEFQVEDIISIFEDRKESMAAIHAQLGAIERELLGLLQVDKPDVIAVGQHVIDLHNLKAEIRLQALTLADSIEVLLTESQKKKLAIARSAAALQPVVGALKQLGLLLPKEQSPPGQPRPGK
jgi:hypothetical protein